MQKTILSYIERERVGKIDLVQLFEAKHFPKAVLTCVVLTVLVLDEEGEP